MEAKDSMRIEEGHEKIRGLGVKMENGRYNCGKKEHSNSAKSDLHPVQHGTRKNRLIIIKLFFYSTNSCMADRCAVQDI